MTTRTRRWCGALVAGLCAVGAAAADEREATPRRLYDVSTETGMPHLDENLRYAVRREQRCLAVADRATVFWMLQDVSLQDCRLEPLDDATYRLACHGGHGTTGDASWQSDARDRWTGTLNVRLGGKNMTFFQRVTATPVGECGDAHARP